MKQQITPLELETIKEKIEHKNGRNRMFMIFTFCLGLLIGGIGVIGMMKLGGY